MFPRVASVRPTGDYRLELTFEDGLRAELDFRDDIVGRGGIFRPLEDPGFFRQVAVIPAETIGWPNGVDFCPDVLYSRASGKPIPFSEQETQSGER